MTDAKAVSFSPIGVFHCHARYPYDVPRQGVLAAENTGWIELDEGRNFEAALSDLGGFSRIWVLFLFDRNDGQWRPKVQPPRYAQHRIGVFATRSPYRPNPIGLSCVEVLEVQGRCIKVQGHDLLDGTPILDIKPYLPYADAFPEAKGGWTAENHQINDVRFASEALEQLAWLAERGVECLADFIREQLGSEPLNARRHRLILRKGAFPQLAYRTWRVEYKLEEKDVRVLRVLSGYTQKELDAAEDKYADKELHRIFRRQFPTAK